MALDPSRVPTHLQRPGSSHSIRSVSHMSQRSASRLSQRAIIKQPRLAALLKTLVKQVTNLNENYASGDIQEGMALASRRIDQMKQASVPDLAQIDAHIRGHVEKARINIKDKLANALTARYAELKDAVMQRNDLDMDIKLATLPSHLHFLLLLSSPPTSFVLSQVDKIIAGKHDPEPSSHSLTWENILREEPFEGQHWQGAYDLPESSTIEYWEEESSGSNGFSVLDDAENDEDTLSSNSTQPICQPKLFGGRDPVFEYLWIPPGRAVIDALHDRQYWRFGWRTDTNCHKEFDIGMPSSLGPTLDRILMNDCNTFYQQNGFINEVDAVREVLMMLQGRQSCLFESTTAGQEINILLDRRIIHLTIGSQLSNLGKFAALGSILNPLRGLVQDPVIVSPGGRCRTIEAFFAAVERQLHDFDLWCAEKETNISLAQQGRYRSDHIVSLLILAQEVSINMAGTFADLLDVARNIGARRDRTNPSTMSAFIMNMLLEAVRTRVSASDSRTAIALMDVLRESAEPLWSNLEKWLKDGIPIRAGFENEDPIAEPTWDEKEFFIRINPLVEMGALDFWEGSFTLPPSRDGSISRALSGERPSNGGCLPVFLINVAEDILAAGKAVGLLRAINMIHLVGNDWLGGWMKFKNLTKSLQLDSLDRGLEELISDTLLPPCRLAQSLLCQVLVEECQLWKHLHGLESICLMTRGDAMSQFSDKLFARMDSRQPWNDFHFLNTAFREVTHLGSQTWIHAPLVRLTHRGNKGPNFSRSVTGIDGLAIEYAVPFPLTYLFGPESSASYSSLFCFLLQIRRAKSVLDRILLRGLNSSSLDYRMPDLKVFHVLRRKLSWFVNTLMNFIMSNAIHAGLLEFHEVLRDAASLDEMISTHRSHLERLLGLCFLQPNASPVHRAILSILDLTLDFSDCLSAFAGNTSLDITRHSLVLIRHRHRRKDRRGHARKPDVIGFAEALLPSEDDESHLEEDDDDDDDDSEGAEPSALDSSFISLHKDNFIGHLERMGLELDDLVHLVRRSVDSLAAEAGDASMTFGILSFCLEEWKM